jgi:hypothetical protein
MRAASPATTTSETIPAEFIQAVLREHLADPSARLTDLHAQPIPSDGFSGNRLYRVRLAWTRESPTDGPDSATWVLKRWLPGGHSERQLGVTRPLEAIAWMEGILRPMALPRGVVVPILSTRVDPREPAAWIVMEDVSAALREYSRDRQLPPAEVPRRAKQILDGLARLHTRWERPDHQTALRAAGWLVPFERFLWCEAASYAALLGRPALPGLAPGSPLTAEYRADVQACLGWLPSGDRKVWEELLCRRESLVDALRTVPCTLLHGDADDRNIGLRWPPGSASSGRGSDGSPALVLIDWE